MCSDCYGQLVAMARASRKLQLVLAVLGKRGMEVLFGILDLVAEFFHWADIVKKP